MTEHALPDPDRTRTERQQLAAMRSDFSATIARHAAWLLDNWTEDGVSLTPAEAFRRATTPSPFDVLEQEPEEVSFHELANLMTSEPERGARAWERIKAEARQELQTGFRTARAHERTFATPYERAQFLVILESLGESLKPKGAAEALLVHQLASAFERWLRWQTIATQRADEECWQGDRDRRREYESMRPAERERHDRDHGWIPPRQGQAEAIEQAVMIADRYQRAYVRLLKALRDMRRVLGPVFVSGGQLNVAEQQIVTRHPCAERRPVRARTKHVPRVPKRAAVVRGG